MLLPPGAEVDVALPNTGCRVTERVVRAGDGVLAIAFHQDQGALAQLDRALDAITGGRRGV